MRILTLLGLVALAACGFYLMSMHIAWVLLGIAAIGLLVLYLIDITQPGNAIYRNFPILGRMRKIAAWMRPKIHQYFIENDTEGRPFSKLARDLVYHRSEKTIDTTPFGTQLNVYADGYEWMNHSIAALDHHDLDPHPRVIIGEGRCKQPYFCSLFNISAMSYGSLSSRAVAALNGGAALGQFAHNTGEGGISPYHLEGGGDLIYQLGTGYFGARAADGNFDPIKFQERCDDDRVKMIELKLSQGAKPGHGGILPAKKVTKEISEIRGVPMGQDVLSPPYHKAFSTPIEMLELIQQMRDLSGGKPVGFKLCIGHRAEFLSICKAMIHTGILPDYIAIDGGEGGTGAAPLEFSNRVGMPFREGIAFAYDALVGFGLKEQIRLFTAGKIISGFDLFRALALGADVCYSARGMMLALGCIQALECNLNSCPTGVATQDPRLVKGLVVRDKKEKVAHYHGETMRSFVELMGAAGISNPDMINRSHVYRRIEQRESKRYDQLYPYIDHGCLLSPDSIPESFAFDMGLASADKFLKHQPLTHLHI